MRSLLLPVASLSPLESFHSVATKTASWLLATLLLTGNTLPAVDAQFAPPRSTANLTVVQSPVNSNVTVSYKVPRGACKTAFDRQKQYTGWVNVPSGPAGNGDDYETNLFFWFVEAREPTKALTVWLNGGPGASSLYGFFTGNGPCEVVEKSKTVLTTVTREWGWDRASNMLFIDQPNQVGFSYDKPVEVSLDLTTNEQIEPPRPAPKNQPKGTFLNGTLSSLDATNTANTTDNAAMAVWHLLQGFLAVHPEYNPPADGGDTAVGVNLFAESYGGKYGPVFAETWERQNQLRRDQSSDAARNATLEINLKALGIVNGCIDTLIEAPLYAAYAHENPYGIEVINSVLAGALAAKFASPDEGCADKVRACRAAVADRDPRDVGADEATNALCRDASQVCFTDLEMPYLQTGRNAYDVAHVGPDAFPPLHFLEYLNRREIQEAIGTPLNFSLTDPQVSEAFFDTADVVRGGTVPALARLLDSGVRVALIYGDRDFICNWKGGEAVSLELARQSAGEYPAKFTAAGYTDILVNDSYVGGAVRQYGNLSFSRIYQAGHEVASYQPEAAFQIFARVIMGRAVATGEIIEGPGIPDDFVYVTEGPANATKTLKPPADIKNTCYLRSIPNTCNDDDLKMIAEGKGVIINGVLYAAESDWPGFGATMSHDSGPDPTLTGIYTATPDDGAMATSPTWGMIAVLVMVVALQRDL